MNPSAESTKSEEEQEGELQYCDACEKPKHPNKALLKCSRCHRAAYHDKDCQKQHWPRHKGMCRRWVQQKQEQKIQQQNVKVETSETKGRIVIALKDFQPGDRIFLESPALIFDTRLEYWGLLEAFGNAAPQIRKQVLELHAPPLSKINSVERQQRHERLEQQRLAFLYQHSQFKEVVTQETTQKLLAIIETNAHQLFNAVLTSAGGGMDGSSRRSQLDTDFEASADPNQWMGLFLWGSMVEHSCAPNTTMNTTRDGKLELIAESFIKEGDAISFSYIEGIFEKSRQQRQDELHKDKHFICACSRCHFIDDCRPILLLDDAKNNNSKCELCQKSHPVFWHGGRSSYICIMVPHYQQKTLTTSKIDDQLERFFQLEDELIQKFRTLETCLETGSMPFPTIVDRVVALIASPQWKTIIHPLHWLQVSAHHFLSTTAAASARMQSPPNANKLRLSVLALLHNMAYVECMAALMRQGSKTKTTEAFQLVLQTLDDPSFEDKSVRGLALIRRELNTVFASQHGQFSVKPGNLEAALRALCESPGIIPTDNGDQDPSNTTSTADVLLTAFYAGQDLILAGHIPMALSLYKRYVPWFEKLKQPSDENRARIDVLLTSQGSINPFSDTNMLQGTGVS